MRLTQFARACGRVPIGGHPDKRPDSRQELEDGWRGMDIPSNHASRFLPRELFSEQRSAAGGETGEPRISTGDAA
jgi:hypothetical protein